METDDLRARPSSFSVQRDTTLSPGGTKARSPPHVKRSCPLKLWSRLTTIFRICWRLLSSRNWLLFHNRSQRSCGQGNFFTGVCLSTGGGEGVCLSACWDAIPTPTGWRTPPMENPPGGRTPPDGEPPPQMENHPPREADSSIRSTSGRYASYWNAFLFC